jgi:hypothetical protein
MPFGQHCPHSATLFGSQQTPSGVITWPGLVQGATHLLPLTRIWPAMGQGTPVSGVGQIECVGLRLLPPGTLGWPQSGGTAGRPVLSQMQT